MRLSESAAIGEQSKAGTEIEQANSIQRLQSSPEKNGVRRFPSKRPIERLRIAPNVEAAHPAFDVTPNKYITAIFTQSGVARAPYTESLAALASAAHSFSAA